MPRCARSPARGERSASSPTSRRRTVRQQSSQAAVEQLGGVDIVVNNVGGSGARDVRRHGRGRPSRPCSTRTCSRRSTSRTPRCPSLRARGGGVIAMIASIWGREGGGGPSYNIAKAAEISLAKAMATDLARDGVRVFSVAPGSTLFPGGSWERRTREDPKGIGGVHRARAAVRAARNRGRDRRRRCVHGVPARLVGGRRPASPSTAASRTRSSLDG